MSNIEELLSRQRTTATRARRGRSVIYGSVIGAGAARRNFSNDDGGHSLGHLEGASRGGFKRLPREKPCWCLWPRRAVVNATMLKDRRDAKTSIEISRGWRVDICHELSHQISHEICHEISHEISHEMYREFCHELCHARYAIGCSATSCRASRRPRVLGSSIHDHALGRPTSKAAAFQAPRTLGLNHSRPEGFTASSTRGLDRLKS
jgi:hypothetical protein